MAFNIIFTRTANKTYRQCLDYLFFNLENAQAANSLALDIERTVKLLEIGATSYTFCENDDLKKRQLRKIHLLHHAYKIIYRIEDKNVYIEAIFHDLQNYEDLL